MRHPSNSKLKIHGTNNIHDLSIKAHNGSIPYIMNKNSHYYISGIIQFLHDE